MGRLRSCRERRGRGAAGPAGAPSAPRTFPRGALAASPPGGGVTWVHPSWRDLVIDELVLDAAARKEFLENCSVDGLLLALSTGGGRAGTRSLPLLVDDCDWDAAA